MVNPSTSASDSDKNLISNSTKSLSQGVIGEVEGNWECSDSSDSGYVLIITVLMTQMFY